MFESLSHKTHLEKMISGYPVSIFKRWMAGIAVLFAHSLSAQFQDNFSDGDFSANPTWAGQTSLFIVNASGQLQLNDVASNSAILSTSYAETTLNDREWQIWVRQTFAGSDANQSRIYLAANGTPSTYSGTGSAGVEGYFLKLGEALSTDAIKLCRDNGSGSVVEIAAGTPSLISSSFTIRIKVTRSASGEWTVYADPLGGIAYQEEATVTDATFTTSSHFGIVCLYTSSNADNFFFDDLYFGDPIVDTAPPEIISVTATSATSVNVVFSEPVNALDATAESNYIATGSNSPTSATLLTSSEVNLTFGAAFPSNITQTLVVSDINDLAGNTLTSASTEFTWSVISSGAYRSIVFNEVLADPTPVIGLPGAEFVELHNPTDEVYNLEGWQFVNSTTSKTLPSFVLPAGGYVVLCEDDFAALFSSSIGISSFTALNNTGDSLTLINNLGEIIDILVFSISWYDSPEKDDGGWSLEQINPLNPCSGESNWRESQNPLGGTPADVNSVFDGAPDVIQPTILSVEIISVTQLGILFSETMDPSSFDAASISMIPFFTFSDFTWNSDFTAFSVITFPAIEEGIPFELEVSGFTDCSGNAMEPTGWDILIGFEPSTGDILINEIMADPSPVIAGPDAEYIELYNTSDKLIDLKDCLLNEYPFLSQTLIGPGEYLIVADDASVFNFIPYPGTVFLTSFPGLTNSGTEIILENAQGELLDAVNYTLEWYNDPAKDDGGWSLELINPEDPCSDASNWRASVDGRGMTAGEQNSVYDVSADTQAPVFLLLLNEPFGSVTLQFSEPLDENTLLNLVWSINGESQDPSTAFISSTDLSLLILPLPELPAGIRHSISLSGIGDCWGNTISAFTAEFGIPESAEVGDLIINEILFNPYSPGQDFVEIVNTSPRAISLQGWSLANEEGGVPSGLEAISALSFVLLPGEYLLLTEAGHSLTSYYPNTRTNRIWLMENVPTYNIGDGVCYLIMPDGQTSDVLSYTEDMHFPLLDDVKGVSLERIDFNRPSDDRTNWSSAAQSEGFATPGYINSQSFSAGIGDEQIAVTPEVFSPDNDGYQDVAVISYTTDRSNLTGNITIYSSEGNRVRRLMQNELLGSSGQISWNGTGDEGQALGIGIYVIYFEAFDPEGKVSRIKKSCVLAHMLGN